MFSTVVFVVKWLIRAKQITAKERIVGPDQDPNCSTF